MTNESPLIGVLALQGAFEEHQHCLEKVGGRTKQVRTVNDLRDLDGIVLPGGESTAIGLIGTNTIDNGGKTMWQALQEFANVKPTWGTCAGMILLAEKCVGASAVIQNGQALIGGMDILVCRNYFGSQVSSFEMPTQPPPTQQQQQQNDDNKEEPYPGVFIRAPAILSAGPDVTILGKVVATPCRQAAVVLQELETKIANGENVVMMNVIDSLQRNSEQDITYRVVIKEHKKDNDNHNDDNMQQELTTDIEEKKGVVVLPGAAHGTNAREVISAVRKDHLLCTAFHPELTQDYRWHEYFTNMVREKKKIML